jgi:hypothetical protein
LGILAFSALLGKIIYPSTVFIFLVQHIIFINRFYFVGAKSYIRQPFVFSGATYYIHQPFLFVGGKIIYPSTVFIFLMQQIIFATEP